MKKLLSIIIPTYNMEEYLPRCIDSVVGTKYIDDVEILVVNDGSKDRSSEIAHSYESRFPQSVVVIDKENGNYGSTINAALPVATGKYVKILDADDWFDPEAFDIYLEKLRDIEADLIVTPFTRCHITGESSVRSHFMLGDEGIDYDLSLFAHTDKNRTIDMHAITYKLSLLTDNGYRQTEGISYTDTEWALYPMEHVKVVRFISENLYQYFLGREGQTMSGSEASKNLIKYLVVIYSRLVEYLSVKQTDDVGTEYIYHAICMNLRRDVYTSQPFISQDEKYMDDICRLEDVIAKNKKLYELTNNISMRRYLWFKLVKHWRNHNRKFTALAKYYLLFTIKNRN